MDDADILSVPSAVNDAGRLDALGSYAILETPPEQGFDDIVQLASQTCGTRAALISLIASDRQWFKAGIGFPTGAIDLDVSVCVHALEARDLLVIPDLSRDPRTRTNPLVTGAPHLRFYGGAPLRTPDDKALGTLCVLDFKPRPEGLTASQADGLRALGRQVMSQLELRRALASRDALLLDREKTSRERDVYQRTRATISSAGGDLDSIFDALLTGAMEAVPRAEAGVIQMIDGDELEYRAVRGTVTQYLGLRVSLAGSVAGRCALNNEPMLVADMLADPHIQRDLVTRLGARAALFAPVVHAGKVIAVLKLHARKADVFTASDLMMTQLFASAVASGLTEARAAAAVRAVRKSESRYRAIFESAVDFGIVATDRDGLVTDWNTGAERIFGWSAEEIRGRNAERFLMPEDRAAGRMAADMRIALAQGRATDERWHLRKDGSRFWAVGEMMPLLDGGTHLGFLKVLRDRTQARKDNKHAADTERALAVSEERQRLAADATGIGIFDFDPTTGALAWDARVRSLFGVGPREQVTYEETFLGGVHPADRAAADAAVRGALDPSGSGTFDIAYRVVPASGEAQRWLAARGQAIVENGRTVRFIGTVRDVTAQKAAELSLATTQERYRLALRATNDAVWDWDLATNHVLWNEALEAAHGHPLDGIEPTGDWWLSHIHPDDCDRVARSIHAVMDGDGQIWSDKYRFLRHDGSYAAIVDRGYVIRDASGCAVRMVGAMLDVTQLRASERMHSALVALHDRTRDVEDPAAISFTACEVLGTALDANRVGYGIVDTVAETIVIERDWTAPGIPSLAGTLRFRDYGSYIEELTCGTTVVVSDATTDPRTQDTAAALAGINTRAFVNMPLVEHARFVALLFVTQDAARAWSDAELALIREISERTRVAVERARLEQQQRRQAAQLAELNATLEQQVGQRTQERDRVWRSTNDLMGTAGLDGYLKAVNPAWTRMLGWSEAELLARPFLEFVDPADHAATIAVVQRLATRETVTDFVDAVAQKGGGQRTIMWDATPDGDLFHIVGRDITALRQTEEALRQSQKMEAVGQLTGGIAHDFNNLLTGISGSLELLTTRVAQGRLGDVDRYANAAHGAAKRAAALTHRLLAFSRRQTLDPKPTNVNRLITGMEDLVRRTVGPAVTIEVVAAVGLWQTLVDPPQLESALLNLCINARDAMPEGGRITIETANKWLDARAAKERDLEPGQYISLCVSDTGTGMTPDVIAKAFDPFFTTKPLGQGTGLGLSMIYGFVRQSGGQVRIYSEIGEGANLCLYLPRFLGEEDTAEASPEPSAPVRAQAGETVLVVDDEPTVRMLVTEVLEDLGYAAIEAADGAAGLKVLQSDVRIDLLVTDVGLPGGMNGRQMADTARAGRPDLKVLFITGYAENAVLGNGHLAHGMHVMTKPFAMDALAARIKALIDSGP